MLHTSGAYVVARYQHDNFSQPCCGGCSCCQALVWLVAACPAPLALVAAVRLVNLLARKQLVHASLNLGVVLTELPESSSADACLVFAVLGYFLLVLYLVSTDVPTLMAALTALGGSAWTVLKAVSTARDMESSLRLAEVSSESLATKLNHSSRKLECTRC